MIRKPKQPSFKLPLLAACLILLLLVFFVYATRHHMKFFFPLVIALVISLGVLSFIHIRFVRRQTEIDLEKQDYLERINLLEAQIIQEQKSIHAFQEKILNYLNFKNVIEKLSLSLTIADTSNTLSSEVGRLFAQAHITIILYLFQSKTGELGLSFSQKGQMQINLKNKKGDIFDQWVIKAMQPLLIEDARSDFRFDMDKIALEDQRTIRSVISIPLTIHNKTLGLLRVDSPQEKNFTTEDLRVLMTMGSLGAVAIENAQLYERIQDLAIHDGLTGLYLRRYLLERVAQEISRELRGEKELSFLMIDLDHFKDYNDRFGHMAGDIVLKNVGMILSDFFKEAGNLVCRYGGEEFAVVLPDCSKAKALDLADKVRKRIENQRVVLRREKTAITVSIGVAAFPGDARIREELIHKADEALYKAKQMGRNKVRGA